MGSGSGGPYSGTHGGSQPYAERYHVIRKELNKDKRDPDIYSSTTGYFKNPTAQNLTDAMTPTRVVFEGKSAEGKMTYVMDKNGDIIFGKRANPNDARKRAPHPTLIGGKDPQVQCAGMITFHKGRILSADKGASSISATKDTSLRKSLSVGPFSASGFSAAHFSSK